MFNVDGGGIERLRAIFSLMARLSDVIVMHNRAGGIEFFAENSSQTVHTRAFVLRAEDEPRPRRDVSCALKSASLDKIFGTIGIAGLDSCTLELRPQHLVVHARYHKLKRTHKLDLLDVEGIAATVDPANRESSVKGAHAFVLRVDMLKDILSHFSSSAEMVELWLDDGGGVRWRGYRNPQRATREDMYSKIDSTAAMHYTEMLQGLRVEIPWRAEFKLKELRHTAQFLEKVCRDGEVCCIFNEPGAPLSFCTGGGSFSYCVEFATLAKPRGEGREQIKWQLAPLEFCLVPEPTEGDGPEEDPFEDVSMDPPEPERREPSPEIGATPDVSVETWDSLNPHAEIPSTQQERVKGLFD